jgi:hypothetical protein
LLFIPGGSITYYSKGNFFVSQCDVHSVGNHKCKRTRTCAASKSGKGPQGRALGFLAAFCLHTACDGVPSCDGHYQASKTITVEQRKAARESLKDFPGAQAFFDLERPRREDEDEEPQDSVA